ncbi:hypothetical protein ALP39_04883 [Pseudomonas marginalis pv. marginalis]|nr:hypothetical protein ALP39_04883 [Pseudomonas marginalis pv. marginalis]
MADGEVAVGHPDAVAPGDVGTGFVHIGIGRAYIGDGREQHGVEAELIHPVFQIDAPGLLQAAQAVGHGADFIPGRDAALGHAHVFVHAGGEVVFTVGQGAGVVWEDFRAVHIRQAVEGWVIVGAQEVVKRPGGQFPQLVVQKCLGHQAAGKHCRCTGAIAFAVGHQREIHLDDFGTRRFQRLAGVFPQVDHAVTGVDPLPGRAADAGLFAGAGVGVGIDVHARYAQALAHEVVGCCGQLHVRRRAHVGDAGDRHPGLQAPQVATGVGVLGDHHVEHFQQVGHGARIGHHHVHGRRQGPVATHRNHPTGRGVGAQAIVGRRAAPAGPGFLCQTERRETGGGCSARAVGRAGGKRRREVAGVIWAFGTAIHATLHAAVGHRRHIGLAQADGATGAQAFDGERVAMGGEPGKCRAAGGRRQALDQVAVLGGVGNAIQWPQRFALGPACIGRLGFFKRFGVAHHHGIQRSSGLRAVVGLDPCKVSLDQFNGSGLAGFKRSAQLGNGDFGNLHDVFFAALS